MYVSKKTEFGLRLMIALARHPDRRLSSEELAEATAIPRQLTLKLTLSLAKSGLVKAQRGVGGGLQLACTPAKIALQNIMDAVDPPSALMKRPAHSTRDTSPAAVARLTLQAIEVNLERKLKSITLAEIVREQVGNA